MKAIPGDRYLRWFGVSAACLFAVAWIWIVAMPLAYMDTEYPSWLAKRQMLAGCDLGEVLVVGDSRAAVDIVPALLGVKTTNLAVGGGQAIEAFIAVSRALDCPVPPKRVVVSLNAGHFVKPDLFWERSIRFGALNHAELAEVLQTAVELDDSTVLSPRHKDGLPPQLRAWLYAIRFPPLYFAGVLKAGGFLRYWQNKDSLDVALASRGQYYFGTDPGSSVMAADGELRSFVPLPIQDHYFNAMLARLAAREIPVDFIAMPLNRSTYIHVRPEVEGGYSTYLAGYAARFGNFSVVGKVMPDWPDRFFGDAFAHLNPDGATVYSAGFGACLQARLGGHPAGMACDIGWGGAELAQVP